LLDPLRSLFFVVPCPPFPSAGIGCDAGCGAAAGVTPPLYLLCILGAFWVLLLVLRCATASSFLGAGEAGAWLSPPSLESDFGLSGVAEAGCVAAGCAAVGCAGDGCAGVGSAGVGCDAGVSSGAGVSAAGVCVGGVVSTTAVGTAAISSAGSRALGSCPNMRPATVIINCKSAARSRRRIGEAAFVSGAFCVAGAAATERVGTSENGALTEAVALLEAAALVPT
jgi:hypothetical protein